MRQTMRAVDKENGMGTTMTGKRLFRTTVAVFAAMALMGSAAAADCAPIPPKDVEGYIEVITGPAPGLPTVLFEQNGCDWGGAEGLNGVGGLILDVEGTGGTDGNILALVGPDSRFLVLLRAYFLDADCARVEGSEFEFITNQQSQPDAKALKIPSGVKWLVVANTSGDIGNDITVTLHSDGLDCKAKKKKKKKKKKRR